MLEKERAWIGAGALIVILLVGYLLIDESALPPGEKSSARAKVPPLTKEIKQQLAASHGFQYLVSYTNKGFEPAELTLKKGEAVRFTNNSSHNVWIAADGTSAPLYPAVQNGCGSSALDSCHALRPGDFWEFTFAARGTWGYRDNLDKSKAGVVHAQ